MAYDVRLKRSAENDLENILKSVPRVKDAFKRAFDRLRRNPYPDEESGKRIKKLTNNEWRYRVSNQYRMRYKIENQTVVIQKVRHRKDIYRDL